MVRKILCPTDLTTSCRRGLNYALRLAKDNDAELIVFNATCFPSIWQYGCELDADGQWEKIVYRLRLDQLLADAERQVTSFFERTFGAECDGVVWKPRAALGYPVEEIVRAALQEEADLIVMARCKRTMLARVFRPSISEAVARTASCPVVSIDANQLVSAPRGWRLPVLNRALQAP